MIELIYRISNNVRTIEHKTTLPEDNLNVIMSGIITILRAEWQEEAIEQVLTELLK